MGAKKTGMLKKKCTSRSVFFFVTTYGNKVLSVGGHKKKHVNTERFTPFEALFKTCL